MNDSFVGLQHLEQLDISDIKAASFQVSTFYGSILVLIASKR